MRRKRQNPTISAGSMADIAFLLLVFFLVTSNLNTEWGIKRILPRETSEETAPMNRRNVLDVLVNGENNLLVNDQSVSITDLRARTREFLLNANNDPKLPEKVIRDIPLIGQFPVSKQVVSLKSHVKTHYKTYMEVQNELTAAYNEIRDDLARQYFGSTMDQLEESHQVARIKAIRQALPLRISEAAPVQ